MGEAVSEESARWVSALGLILAAPLAARAAEAPGALARGGLGVAAALAFSALLAGALYVTRRRRSTRTGRQLLEVEPDPGLGTTERGVKRPGKRIERLRCGLAERRQLLSDGGSGFLGDALVLARYREGLERLARGEPPAGADLPPGTISRLRSIYEQLLKAPPQRARAWSQARAEVALGMREALGPARSEQGLAILDRLAELRAQRQQPPAEQVRAWAAFLGHLEGAPSTASPAESDPGALAEEPPTLDTEALFLTREGVHAEDEDAQTLDTEAIFAAEAQAEAAVAPGDDPPTLDPSELFAPGQDSSAAAAAPSLGGRGAGLPADREREGREPRTSAEPEELEEQDPPTLDTSELFGAPAEDSLGESEDPPTVDTGELFRVAPEPEADPPTVDVSDLFGEGARPLR